MGNCKAKLDAYATVEDPNDVKIAEFTKSLVLVTSNIATLQTQEYNKAQKYSNPKPRFIERLGGSSSSDKKNM
jgi:hypothetical protein